MRTHGFLLIGFTLDRVSRHYRLNPPHTRAAAFFFGDFERPECAGMLNMGAAADFIRKITHFVDLYLIAVFGFKKPDSALFFSFANG